MPLSGEPEREEGGLSSAARKLQKFVATAGRGIGEKLDAHLAALSEEFDERLKDLPETDVEEGTTLDEALALVYRLSTAPYTLGRVIDTHEYETSPGKKVPMVRVATGTRIVEVHQPKNISLGSGATVRLNGSTSQIVGLAESIRLGNVATVREVGVGFVLVEVGGVTRAVYSGSASRLSRGDRVVLDEMQILIVHSLPKDSKCYALGRAPKNTFDDIVGQDEAVKLLRDTVNIDPSTDPIAKHYNRPRIKGCFIFGPPGCGKSMLGEAVADGMAKKYGKQALEGGCIVVSGPEVLNKFVGDTERAIRDCFEDAEQHFAQHAYPAVLIFDECEALLSRRGTGTSADMEKTVVPTFLGCMNETSALVLLMTNRPDVVDPAVIRDGRCDRQILIGRPTRESAEIIIRKNLAKYPLDSAGSSIDVLARVAAEGVYDSTRHLVDEPLRLATGENAFFTLAHIVNGAMLARLVSDAAANAELRDRGNSKLSGISEADIIHALECLFVEKKKLTHADELDEFYQSMKERLVPQTLLQTSAK